MRNSGWKHLGHTIFCLQVLARLQRFLLCLKSYLKSILEIPSSSTSSFKTPGSSESRAVSLSLTSTFNKAFLWDATDVPGDAVALMDPWCSTFQAGVLKASPAASCPCKQQYPHCICNPLLGTNPLRTSQLTFHLSTYWQVRLTRVSSTGTGWASSKIPFGLGFSQSREPPYLLPGEVTCGVEGRDTHSKGLLLLCGETWPGCGPRLQGRFLSRASQMDSHQPGL